MSNPDVPRDPSPTWRSLEERAGTPEFRDLVAREFPSQAEEWTDPESRRQFLRLMGASLTLAGVTGCAFQPPEQIVPFVRQPEELLPGRPLHYATAVTVGGYALGVLAKCDTGRPIKIEGNELHPASLGSTDAFAQASILGLYDPDRSSVVLLNGRVNTWNDFLASLITTVDRQRGKQGTGLRILTGDSTSPTLGRLLNKALDSLPKARWCSYESVQRSRVREGLERATGKRLEPIYDLEQADVIVALDADLFGRGPQRVRLARDFAKRRTPGEKPMNRLFVAEPSPTPTGAIADHRLPLSARRITILAAALAREVGVIGAPPPPVEPSAELAQWIRVVARDLKAHAGSSLVVIGDDHPPELHALAAVINQTLGNTGKSVTYIEPPMARPNRHEQAQTLDQLAAELKAGAVEALLILGGNPAYDAPVDLELSESLPRVPFSTHLGLYEDETAALCQWHIPMAHELESWGDARAYDGTATIQQPLIAPLYGGRSAIEVAAALVGETTRPPLELIKETWRIAHGEETDFETFWKKSLHDGVIAGTAAPIQDLSPKAPDRLPQPDSDGLELVFQPDPTVHDGQFANNGWLQELPKPMTRLTWDNPALVSPESAARLGVTNGDMIRLDYQGRTLEVAVWVQPGQAKDSVTLSLGYGRTRAGRVGTGAGFNAQLLRSWDDPGFGSGLTARRTGRTYTLATTQLQQMIDQELADRELVLAGPLAEYQKDEEHYFQHLVHKPAVNARLSTPPEPLRRRQELGEGNAWAMVIDLNTCIGCGVCTVACQAENNIPVVGKKQVIAGRAMHWIRVDHYFKGDPTNPKHYHQPVPCMHCENAPCELVCPVAATTHSAEGLNEMTYNRCVGTRYCGNNCPYKVRRFNFLQYTDLDTPSLKLLNNPDVTVRTRGIMEKCTYCVQRINATRMAVEKEGRNQVLERDGLQTACQQACPTQAILFGNQNELDGSVAKAQRSNRNYALLAELNTRPRTSYQARLTNPNTELESE